jgi:hypothetical protein
MGILDTLKAAAAETLKTVAEEALKSAAGASSASAKAEALVGSKATGTTAPPAASPSNQAASAKAASLVGSKAAPNEQPYAASNELSRAEVESMIDARVRAKNMRSNWRSSIVDLMTALDMNSSLGSRVALASKLNYSGRDADGSAAKNMWLHEELLKVLAKNRGDVPWELMAAVNTSPSVTPTPVTQSLNPAVLSSNVAASVTAAASAASKAAALAAGTAGSNPAPNELSRADVDAIIEARARAKGGSNWSGSIVDLMTALGMNSSLSARTVLAARLNYSGRDADGSAEKNMWLHAELLKALAQNGGEVPSYLL